MCAFASSSSPDNSSQSSSLPSGHVFIAATLDGKIARSDGTIDFLDEYQNSTSNDMGFSAFLDSVDALVMGRKSFDKVVSFGVEMWAYGLKPVVVWTRNVECVQIPSWLQVKGTISSSSLSPKDLFDELGRLGRKNVYVDGGVTIREFLSNGLIQSMEITVVPLILGSGVPLFMDMSPAKVVPMRHVRTKVYDNGLIQSRYEVLHGASTLTLRSYYTSDHKSIVCISPEDANETELHGLIVDGGTKTNDTTTKTNEASNATATVPFGTQNFSFGAVGSQNTHSNPFGSTKQNEDIATSSTNSLGTSVFGTVNSSSSFDGPTFSHRGSAPAPSQSFSFGSQAATGAPVSSSTTAFPTISAPPFGSSVAGTSFGQTNVGFGSMNGNPSFGAGPAGQQNVFSKGRSSTPQPSIPGQRRVTAKRPVKR